MVAEVRLRLAGARKTTRAAARCVELRARADEDAESARARSRRPPPRTRACATACALPGAPRSSNSSSRTPGARPATRRAACGRGAARAAPPPAVYFRARGQAPAQRPACPRGALRTRIDELERQVKEARFERRSREIATMHRASRAGPSRVCGRQGVAAAKRRVRELSAAGREAQAAASAAEPRRNASAGAPRARDAPRRAKERELLIKDELRAVNTRFGGAPEMANAARRDAPNGRARQPRARDRERERGPRAHDQRSRSNLPKRRADVGADVDSHDERSAPQSNRPRQQPPSRADPRRRR